MLALISALPLVLALALVSSIDGLQTRAHGFDPATLALGVGTRMALYLLVSIVMIKATLALSKAIGVVRAQVRPAGTS